MERSTVIETWIANKTGEPFHAIQWTSVDNTVDVMAFTDGQFERDGEHYYVWCAAANQKLPVYPGEWVADLTYDNGKPTWVPLSQAEIEKIGERA